MRNMFHTNLALWPEPHRSNGGNPFRDDVAPACRRCGQPWPCQAFALEIFDEPEVDA